MAYMCGRIVLGVRAVHSSTSSLGTLHVGLELRHRFDRIVGGQNFFFEKWPKKILPRTFWNALTNRAKRKLSFGLRKFCQTYASAQDQCRCGTMHCSVVCIQSDYGWHWVRLGKKVKSDFRMKTGRLCYFCPEIKPIDIAGISSSKE